MGRHKTISDEDVLRIARDVFRHHGHTATTRQIADAIGLSEAVLYQRFGSKDQLFFTAMHATGPDVERLLGPPDPPDDALAYLQFAVTNLANFFSEIIPLALRVMTHPSFVQANMSRMQPHGPPAILQGFTERIKSLSRRRLMATGSEAVTARLLASLAHDWALRSAFTHGASSRRTSDLDEIVAVIWEGLRPTGKGK
jgi:AcrR family transcriptional regulator